MLPAGYIRRVEVVGREAKRTSAGRAGGLALCVLAASLLSQPLPVRASSYSPAELRRFQASIVDHRGRLYRGFRKVRRERTDLIVVHTSEGSLKGTLRVVSRGKVVRGRRITPGGHAHYVIARDGTCYRTLDRKYVADHAGQSLWDGVPDVSRISVGIELVGYHYAPITAKQYRSLGMLLELLQKIYGLEDRQVVTHSQVAYGNPNPWVRTAHRGRKRCAKNFERAKAGLGPTWTFDPDVRSGRLVADAELARVYYGVGGTGPAGTGSNVISGENTAWSIAGDEYDSAATLYQLPGGAAVPGDRIGATIGWRGIPKGTVVLLNAGDSCEEDPEESPVREIGSGKTAWTVAGPGYARKTTFYFFPDGTVHTGSEISRWDDLPAATRLIVGYDGPHEIVGDNAPLGVAGGRHDHRKNVYLFPDNTLRTGNDIDDVRSLPPGVRIFLSVEES